MIWLLAAVLVLVAAFGMTFVATAFAVATGLSPSAALRLLGDPGSSPLVTSPIWIVATIVVNELAVASAFSLGASRLELGLREILPLSTPRRATLAASALLVFGLAPVAQLFAELASRFTGRDSVSAELVRTLGQDTSLPGFLLGMLLVGILPALCEEALFRGLLMRCFERLGVALNLLVTSALFALLHLEPSQVAGTFVLGFGFGLVRYKTNSIVPCMLAHAVYNAAVVAGARFSPDIEPHAIHPLWITLGLVLFGLSTWWLWRPDRSSALRL
jgi:membrane protease YdiL (CAAX protease family)